MSILTDFLNQGKDTSVKFVQDFAFGQIESLGKTGEKVLEEKIEANKLNGSGPVDADLSRSLPQTFEETITGKAESPDVAVAQNNTPLLLIAGLAGIAAVLFLTQKG